MSNTFPLLFSPIAIGPVPVKNRIVSMAHSTFYSTDHLIGDRHIAYYEERAKGGLGLIVLEQQVVSPNSQSLMNECAGYDDRNIPRYRELTGAVHAHGTKIFAQIAHAGLNIADSGISGLPLWAPSAVPVSPIGELPHVMTVSEIVEVQEAFEKAAARVKEGGFDGVELHASHGYLIGQFFSPLTNHRKDSYGADCLENRVRFACEVIERVRNEVGQDFVVGIRICGDEFVPGGLTLEDAKEIASRLEATEMLDYLSVSGGTGMVPFMIVADMRFPLGGQVYLASGIKEVVQTIPVFASQRIKDPVQAERILAEGHADMVGMTRATICDPELPDKAIEGRLKEIRYCVGCNQLCAGNALLSRPIGCVQNPAVGREREWGLGTLEKAERLKDVVVIGGGPAGMEAARTAALRGHRVRLFERAEDLGGQLNLMVKMEGRKEFEDMKRHLTLEIERLGVEVSVGEEMSADRVREISPEALVIATGSDASVPDDVPCGEADIMTTARAILSDGVDVGERVVVIDRDGYFRSVGVAEHLAKRGCAVTLLTPALHAGMNITYFSLIPQYMELLQAGVRIVPLAGLHSIRDRVVTYSNYLTFEEQVIEDVDNVVVAYPGTANDRLYRELKEELEEIYLVGDSVAPRRVDSAVYEGHKVGRLI